MIDLISSVLFVVGAGFALVGSIGLARFPDVFTRLHGPTKATTLGVGGVLLGTVVQLIAQGEAGAIREILITVFLFLTAPASAHLIAKAALHRRCPSLCKPPEEQSKGVRST